MDAKLSNIYEIANKCGFDVKHREESEKIAFAFKSKESSLNCFIEVVVQNDENDKKFRENVAHEVFLISEDFDQNTETKKYLAKIGGNIKQYDEICSQMTALAWQIRGLWLSL